MSYEILEKLRKEISGFKEEKGAREVGIVSEVGDGILRISGLSGALAQELLSVEAQSEEIPALAFNLEENFIGAVILGDGDKVRVGARVIKTGKVLSIKAGEEILGRVVDPLGRPLDGKGVIFSAKGGKDYFLERRAPSVIERESVSVPLHTGIKAIDAMIPIGRGQRELIIGDRQTGKTAIALDAILNQLQDEGRRKAVSIYVAIGQKNSKIAKTIAMLEERGAMKNTIVVSASASSPASLQYLAPFAGAAIGEYFMDSGMDAVVIYDDLSKHADAYRQLSLLLRRPPGREAYPGDIFYLHARLLERSAKLSKEKGGGSLTALPIIETKLGDVSSYIPTNVISITDGQIYLESGLFYQGVRPAVNVGLSVSRVGSAAQTKAMKKVAGKMRLELAQFRELAAFVQFSSDLDPDTKKKIARGELLTEILKQADLEPAPFEKAVVILYAALSGAMDNIPIPEAQSYASGLLDWLEKLHRDEILGAIRKSSDFTDEVEEKLKAAIKDYGISAKS
ncbi:F0F1 ATP synthase subunit alpha [Candidatus Giovannonibacteria bacterium RIFCSPHIGHO2_12_44_12]|uniref:ATP synthase subunit alpha n=1 Tax=Candidatus Giovannonibacteria bacterium RIFCSPHIGHO2_12_44_12 TaxID=1798340 RepID=A0A1F5WYS9_9BACT|nr:MAG: F0F1 ATP synthase subunit alpha [Candidatus Giovannonibacteria bacterium RIFCSPHIGHO2_12_44_12]